MTVTIALPPVEEKKLAARAAASGQDITAYVRRLIEKDIEQPSFAELFAPLHQAVDASGLGASEIDSLIQQPIADSRHQRLG